MPNPVHRIASSLHGDRLGEHGQTALHLTSGGGSLAVQADACRSSCGTAEFV